MNTDYYTPCSRCGRSQKEAPLKLDYQNKFHICVDAIQCAFTLKKQGKHAYHFGVATASQRKTAFGLANEKGVDLTSFLKTEMGLSEPLFASSAVMSCMIQALIEKQLKAKAA